MPTIAGLVAYSIYKQNKLDWLAAFETAKGRAPNDAELASYIIGEGTPRRPGMTKIADQAAPRPSRRASARASASPMPISTATSAMMPPQPKRDQKRPPREPNRLEPA